MKKKSFIKLQSSLSLRRSRSSASSRNIPVLAFTEKKIVLAFSLFQALYERKRVEL